MTVSELTLQGSGIELGCSVSRVTVVDEFIGDGDAGILELRQDFIAEVLWRWLPSSPPVIWEHVSGSAFWILWAYWTHPQGHRR